MMTSMKRWCVASAIMGAVSICLPISAEAQQSESDQAQATSCADCNRAVENTKVNTTYKYKTVQRVRNVTKYKDVNRTRYEKRVNRVVTVTRIQPITRVSMVTRVHNRTVVLHQTQNVAQTATLPTQNITTGKTIQINHAAVHRSCNCR
jgi:phage-related protein